MLKTTELPLVKKSYSNCLPTLSGFVSSMEPSSIRMHTLLSVPSLFDFLSFFSDITILNLGASNLLRNTPATVLPSSPTFLGVYLHETTPRAVAIQGNQGKSWWVKNPFRMSFYCSKRSVNRKTLLGLKLLGSIPQLSIPVTQNSEFTILCQYTKQKLLKNNRAFRLTFHCHSKLQNRPWVI